MLTFKQTQANHIKCEYAHIITGTLLFITNTKFPAPTLNVTIFRCIFRFFWFSLSLSLSLSFMLCVMCNFILQLLWVDLFFWLLFYSSLLLIYHNDNFVYSCKRMQRVYEIRNQLSHTHQFDFKYTINQTILKLDSFSFFANT